jgi:hypothetical protein
VKSAICDINVFPDGTGQLIVEWTSQTTNIETISIVVLSRDASGDPQPPPPFLYDVETESIANYTVNFNVLDGWEPTENDYYFFRCVQIPSNDGPVTRTFTKTFPPNAYSVLDCTLEDRSSIPGKEMKTITFTITTNA